MSQAAELPPSTHREIEAFCAAGDQLAEAARYEDAVAQYNQAWELVPAPKEDWNASTWIRAAIGDACFLGGHAISARESFEFAMHCPGGIGNPFLHLRLGQLLFDANELDRAADELARAYMGAGAEIFEEQDARYLTFLRTRMTI